MNVAILFSMMLIMDLQLFLQQTILHTLGIPSRIKNMKHPSPPISPVSVSVVMSVEVDIHSESISDVFQLISLLACPVGSKL